MSCAAHRVGHAHGMLQAEDVDLIQEGVRMLPLDRHAVVVDLGAGFGTTALAVLCERPANVTVLTIDRDPEALLTAKRVIERAGYGERWHGILNQSADRNLARAFVPIDMLLVDADHTYEGVALDMEAWLPLLRVGAPIWFHNYCDEPGVAGVVDAAQVVGHIELRRFHGSGWLGVKV